MDLESIKNQVSNLSLYDLKAGFRKAQNAVMNYTEMEAKVREATNNEPWGASSTGMQEIANGTFNYSTLSEIMPMIYKRFTEKSAEEWRQIYKALQLLEFLIKNGSERVIDDARSHLSLLKMLRQFHYIDQNGKDQGINVRNRAKELTDLLGDVERIRAERKKARSTRNKYGGVEGGAGFSSGMTGSGRYGGYGSESSGAPGGGYGGYSGGVFGDGGGFGGQTREEDYGSGSRRNDYAEYDEYDEDDTSGSARRKPDASSSSTRQTRPEPPKKKEPEVDLFDFGDDDFTSAAPAAQPISNGKAAAPTAPADLTGGGDDDFDDFQSATPAPAASSSQFAAPPMASAPSNSSSFGVLSPPPSTTSSQPAKPNYSAFSIAPAPSPAPSQSSITSPPMQAQAPKPSGYQPSGPNYFGSVSAVPPSGASTPGAAGVTSPGGLKPTSISQKKPASGGDPFASLAVGIGKKPGQGSQKGPTMADMAKQKASQGIWGAPAQQGNAGGSGGDLI